MYTDRPNLIELVEAVREFLEKKVSPAVDKSTAYHTRVAVNVLKIVERELESGPDLEAQEHDRLCRLLNQEGTLKELTGELCRRLREGDIDYKNPILIDHLRKTAMGRLSIDNPKYSAYRKALETGLS